MLGTGSSMTAEGIALPKNQSTATITSDAFTTA